MIEKKYMVIIRDSKYYFIILYLFKFSKHQFGLGKPKKSLEYLRSYNLKDKLGIW